LAAALDAEGVSVWGATAGAPIVSDLLARDLAGTRRGLMFSGIAGVLLEVSVTEAAALVDGGVGIRAAVGGGPSVGETWRLVGRPSLWVAGSAEGVGW